LASRERSRRSEASRLGGSERIFQVFCCLFDLCQGTQTQSGQARSLLLIEDDIDGRQSKSSLDKMSEQAVRAIEDQTKDNPDAGMAARLSAQRAAEAVKNALAQRDSVLQKALHKAAAAEPGELRRMITETISLAQARGCDGAICGFGCGVGCGGGCALTGFVTVGFGAAGGTAGGSGTSIVLTYEMA
jgi:hypothetical protein